MLDDAAPGLPEHADAVRVVDDDDRAVLARELDDLRQLRQVALHREHAVRDDQLASPARGGSERVPDGIDVRVRV